jgi:Ca2+-binding EF-hand superfamily protein
MLRVLGTAIGTAVFCAMTVGAIRADDPQQKPGRDPGKLFKKLDTNNDGKLSKEEFLKLGERAQGRRQQALEKIFNRLDANHDGSLTPEEFKKFTEMRRHPGNGKAGGLFRNPAATFAKLDVNGDGKVTKEEFSKIFDQLPGKQKAQFRLLDRLFEKLDANADGSISLDEFMKITELRGQLATLKKKQ